MQQPGLIRKPVAFQTNPAWAEEILRGPGPPKGWKGDTIVRNLQKKRPDLLRKGSLNALEELCREATPLSPSRTKVLEDATTIAATPSTAQTLSSPATNQSADLSRPPTQDSVAAGATLYSATRKESTHIPHTSQATDVPTTSITGSPHKKRRLSKYLDGLTPSKNDRVNLGSNGLQAIDTATVPGNAFKETQDRGLDTKESSTQEQLASISPRNASLAWTSDSTTESTSKLPEVNGNHGEENGAPQKPMPASMRPTKHFVNRLSITSKPNNNLAPANDDPDQPNHAATRPTMDRRLSSAVENIKESLMSRLHPEKWNWRRYDREDELKGFRDRIDQWYRDLSGNSGGTAVLSNGIVGQRKRAATNESDRYDYYRGRNPDINELHPPIASQLPPTHEDAAWMLLPPPCAAVMAGLQRPRPDEPMRYPMNIIGSRAKRARSSPTRSQASEKSPAPSSHIINRKRRHLSSDIQDFWNSSDSESPVPWREPEERRDFSSETITAPEPILVAGGKGKRTLVASWHFSDDCTWTSTG